MFVWAVTSALSLVKSSLGSLGDFIKPSPHARRWVRHSRSQDKPWGAGTNVSPADRHPSPFCKHFASCHQRGCRGTHRRDRAQRGCNPIQFLTLRPPPSWLWSPLHPGIEWPYKNVQRERQIQKLRKHYPDGQPLTSSMLCLRPFPPPPGPTTPSPSPCLARQRIYGL